MKNSNNDEVPKTYRDPVNPFLTLSLPVLDMLDKRNGLSLRTIALVFNFRTDHIHHQPG